MPRQVLFRPKAEADLNDIWTYGLSEWSRGQVVAYLEGLDAALALLCSFPEMARERAEFVPPVRLYPYRAHVVVYMVAERHLDVIRVLHGKSDWHSVLGR